MLYGEGIFVGYRYYERIQLPVLFPFGHGLSYTNFEQKGLGILTNDDESKLAVSLRIQNIGRVPGAEIIQVYISQRTPSISRPLKELKAFEKVMLDPEEEKLIEISLSIKYVTSVWNEAEKKWQSEQGIYDVFVGNSSKNVLLQGSFEIKVTNLWHGL
tara:strand:+ start:1396 stop:1869 length:474 start_codon:yes stop_codon:yes gene_type:complete